MGNKDSSGSLEKRRASSLVEEKIGNFTHFEAAKPELLFMDIPLIGACKSYFDPSHELAVEGSFFLERKNNKQTPIKIIESARLKIGKV